MQTNMIPSNGLFPHHFLYLIYFFVLFLFLYFLFFIFYFFYVDLHQRRREAHYYDTNIESTVQSLRSADRRGQEVSSPLPSPSNLPSSPPFVAPPLPSLVSSSLPLPSLSPPSPLPLHSLSTPSPLPLPSLIKPCRNVDLWNTKFSPRSLTFFDGECKELVEGLQKTTKLIPESKRNFREFSVGFLQFISND